MTTRVPSGTGSSARIAASETRRQPWLAAVPNTAGSDQAWIATVPGPPSKVSRMLLCAPSGRVTAAPGRVGSRVEASRKVRPGGVGVSGCAGGDAPGSGVLPVAQQPQGPLREVDPDLVRAVCHTHTGGVDPSGGTVGSAGQQYPDPAGLLVDGRQPGVVAQLRDRQAGDGCPGGCVEHGKRRGRVHHRTRGAGEPVRIDRCGGEDGGCGCLGQRRQGRVADQGHGSWCCLRRGR